MKVVLLKDVPNTGRKGEVKEVSQGHAINFLIPRKLAKAVSDSQISQISLTKKKIEEENNVKKDLLIKNMKSLYGKEVVLKAKANEKGHLFSQIHVDQVIDAIKEQYRLDVPKDSVSLDHNIKEVGESEIKIALHGVKVLLVLKIEEIK